MIDRPRGSIEYKHQNISAVLKGLGEDWRQMRLWNLAREPKAFELQPPLDTHVSLMATSYQASFL